MTQPSAKEALIKIINESGGEIPLRDYMGFCLSDPTYGYYSTQKPLGKRGDFITAPEISQIFGELIGLWFVNFWESKNQPKSIALLELGPGRGFLMRDILRAMNLRPALLDAIEVHQVEINPHLKQQQISAISPTPVIHHDSVSTALKHLKETPIFLVANEFFDAFPIDQYVYKQDIWQKRYVSYSPENDVFIFQDAIQKNNFDNCTFPMKPNKDTVMETAPLVESQFRELAYHLSEYGGAGLIIDYGYDSFGYGDTLQALSHHKHVNVLENPGQVDLTAHVNFATLLRISQNQKNGHLSAHLETQGSFLKNLGIDIRTDILSKNAKTNKVKQDILDATKRLISPDQMGDLFKVLQIWN